MMWIVNILTSFAPLIIKHWRVALVVITIGGSFGAGWYTCNRSAKAELAEKLQSEIEKRDREISKSRKLSDRINELEGIIESRKGEKVREVVRYVERNPNLSECELDADGLRLWNNLR